MSSYFLKIFYALLLLLLHTTGSVLALNWPSKSGEVKCIEWERQALLKFKQGLLDDSGMLSTWRDDQNDGDCCKWKGIECHNETGHVRMLNLHRLTGAFHITSLINLQNMEYLDLSGNDFIGSHIPELMGLFTKLRYLNLSYSKLGGRIPYQLGNISQLQYLNLSHNSLVRAIPCQLEKVTHLRYLDLSNNYLDGEIPYQLGNLSQLRYFDLRGNYLSGAIPFQIGNLPMLHTLRLGGNFDLKMKDPEWLSNLTYLTNLDLSPLSNLGSSHHWLQMISKLLPNLRELRLSECSLSDKDILSLFDSQSNFSTSLTILDLSSNMLTSSTFQLLFNFSFNLEELYLSYNNLTSSIFQGNFNFGSKLQQLYLGNCSLSDRNFLVPSASIMNSSSSLVFLDLSSNLLTSSAIFHWLFNFTTNLRSLYLNGNLLEGPIPDGFGKVMNSLEDLDLSDNKLQGEIPASFGNICTLQKLDLSNNNLSGEISSFIQNSSWCNRHIFQTLYLCCNRIIGMLLESMGLLSELEHLDLRGNSLEGDVTERHLTNFSKLKGLGLSYNS